MSADVLDATGFVPAGLQFGHRGADEAVVTLATGAELFPAPEGGRDRASVRGADSVTLQIDSVPLPVVVVTTDGSMISWNGRFAELVGGDPSGRRLVDLIVADDRPGVEQRLRAPCRTEPVSVTFGWAPAMTASLLIMATLDDSELLVVAAPVDPASDGDELSDAGFERIATQAHDLLGHGIVIGDGTRILEVTEAAARLFGRPAGELIGIGSLFQLFEPSEQLRLAGLVAECNRTGAPMPERLRTAVVRPNGEVVHVDLWIKASVRHGQIRTYTVIADAGEQALAEAEMAHRATHDHVTGLPNRYLVMDRLESVLRRLRRSEQPDESAALHFIDLDDFKLVNDEFGHAAGDHVLRVIAERLLATVRATDTAARLGGDEFVVLCEPAGSLERLDLSDRLQTALSEPILYDGVEIRSSPSIGTCRFSDDSADAETILARADRDMYRSKRADRAR